MKYESKPPQQPLSTADQWPTTSVCRSVVGAKILTHYSEDSADGGKLNTVMHRMTRFIFPQHLHNSSHIYRTHYFATYTIQIRTIQPRILSIIPDIIPMALQTNPNESSARFTVAHNYVDPKCQCYSTDTHRLCAILWDVRPLRSMLHMLRIYACYSTWYMGIPLQQALRCVMHQCVRPVRQAWVDDDTQRRRIGDRTSKQVRNNYRQMSHCANVCDLIAIAPTFECRVPV